VDNLFSFTTLLCLCLGLNNSIQCDNCSPNYKRFLSIPNSSEVDHRPIFGSPLGFLSTWNKNAEAHNRTQPPTMASISPDSDWECDACTYHPNKGGKYCNMCATARPKRQAVAAAPAPVVAAASARAPACAQQASQWHHPC
jgi:hypothetical protein